MRVNVSWTVSRDAVSGGVACCFPTRDALERRDGSHYRPTRECTSSGATIGSPFEQWNVRSGDPIRTQKDPRCKKPPLGCRSLVLDRGRCVDCTPVALSLGLCGGSTDHGHHARSAGNTDARGRAQVVALQQALERYRRDILHCLSRLHSHSGVSTGTFCTSS